jgi:carboxyl-terminal processing protease
VRGLTEQQATEKIRGQVNTNVVLKILRKGADSPIELAITREIIQIKPDGGASK